MGKKKQKRSRRREKVREGKRRENIGMDFGCGGREIGEGKV